MDNTLALLCSLASWAVSSLQHSASVPWTLFAPLLLRFRYLQKQLLDHRCLPRHFQLRVLQSRDNQQNHSKMYQNLELRDREIVDGFNRLFVFVSCVIGT